MVGTGLHSGQGDVLAAIAAANAVAARGRPAQAGRDLVALAPLCSDNPRACDALARGLYHTGCFAEAAELVRGGGTDDIGSLSGLAASLVALGDLAGAEAVFDRLIALHPADGAAWYNRASLRKRTEADAHIEDMRSALGQVTGDGAIAVHYALAKAMEDLGRHEESFTHLKRGADLRRTRLSYRVEQDVETMSAIARVFDKAWLEAAPASDVMTPGPIFIMGLPRSGTTLVDRILSSHSQVASLGEIPDFALALMETTPRQGDRDAFVRAAADADPVKLAERFLQRLAGYESQSAFLIDKTPVNFLYVGLIARALPNARIVHVRRDPMDVGYALYKTLFQTGCPYAYDLTDIGHYIGAWSRLMTHWREALPGRFIDVDYETLIDDLDGEARRIVAHCGLPWEAACRDFHLNRSPSSTASAAQVRRPLYRSSVGLWRHYEHELAPLAQTLKSESVL